MEVTQPITFVAKRPLKECIIPGRCMHSHAYWLFLSGVKGGVLARPLTAPGRYYFLLRVDFLDGSDSQLLAIDLESGREALNRNGVLRVRNVARQFLGLREIQEHAALLPQMRPVFTRHQRDLTISAFRNVIDLSKYYNFTISQSAGYCCKVSEETRDVVRSVGKRLLSSYHVARFPEGIYIGELARAYLALDPSVQSPPKLSPTSKLIVSEGKKIYIKENEQGVVDLKTGARYQLVNLRDQRSFNRAVRIHQEFAGEGIAPLIDSASSCNALIFPLLVHSLGPLSSHERVHVALDVLGGITRLHQAGKIHGNVSLENIVFDEKKRAYLIGLDEVKEANEVPSVSRDHEFITCVKTQGADNLHLGVVFWELFQMDSVFGMRLDHYLVDAHWRKPLRVKCPLSQVVGGLLHPDPHSRLTAQKACDLLREYQASLPPVARVAW